MIYLLLAAVLAFFLGWAARRRARSLKIPGLPPGEVVYSGVTLGLGKVIEAPRYGIRGSPDYVLRCGEEYIPVEVKSSKTPRRIYESDRMQTVAYAVLVEAKFGKMPKRAFLRYPQKTFLVKIGPRDVARVREAAETMRAALTAGAFGGAVKSRRLCRTCHLTRCPEREGAPHRA